MKTLSASANMPIGTPTPLLLAATQPKPQVRPKPPPKPSKLLVEKALASTSTTNSKIPPATKPKPKPNSEQPCESLQKPLDEGLNLPSSSVEIAGKLADVEKASLEDVKDIQKSANKISKPTSNSSTATLLINNNNGSTRSSKRQNRPKIKPPMPLDNNVGSTKSVIVEEEDLAAMQSLNSEKSSDCVRLKKPSETAAKERLQTTAAIIPQEDKTAVKATNPKRVVRKPSVKPPPPPTAAMPSGSSNTVMVRKWIPATAVIDDTMDGGIQLPKLPSMPPPSPPKLESTLISHRYSDDDGGEKFDELYEEIEQAFYEEKARNSTLNRLSPKRDNDDHQNRTKSSNNTTAQQQQESDEKQGNTCQNFERKSMEGEFSPPDFYRTSTTNLCAGKNRHYDTLSIGKGDSEPTSYNSHQQDPGSNNPTNSMNYSCSNDSAGGVAWNGSGRRSSVDYYKDSADDLSDEEDPDDHYPDSTSSYPFSNSLNSSAINGVSSTATFSAPPLRWRHCGRYDTWSSSTNPKTAAMIRSAVEQSNRDNSTDGRSHSLHKPNFNGGTTGRTKSSHQHKRKSLSELWRFKSELQLNLSKKMDQIRLKVNATNGFSSTRNRPNTTLDHPSSMFYVSAEPCSRCQPASACSHAQCGDTPVDVNQEHLDYWQEDTECISNQDTPVAVVAEEKDDEECIYGDDWSSSSSSEDGDEQQHHDEIPCEFDCSKAVNITSLDCRSSEKKSNESTQKSKVNQTTPAATQQPSLLAEIESAYQELSLKRQQKTLASDQSIMTSEELLESQDPSNETNTSDLPSSSINLENKANEKAEELAQELYDEQRLSQAQKPSSSGNKPPTILQRHSTIESSTDSHSELNNLSGDTTTTTSNSSRETFVHTQENQHEDTKTLLDSNHNPPEGDEEDGESGDSSSLESRSLYTSRLPEPQPLYQIYMKQEQEKLLLEAAPVLAKRLAVTAAAATASNPSESEAQPVATVVPEIISSSKVSLIAQTTIIAPSPVVGPHEEHEADSVCGSCSNETDDIDPSVCIRRQSSSASTDSGRGADAVSHIASSNTSMRRERLTAGSMCGSQRSLWCELAEVKSAGLLETLDDHTKKLQEAFFEVITSEASYLRSINILITSFMAAPELMGSKSAASVITNAEKKHLFSNIQAIRDASERLLCDLESRLKECLVLSDVCDILCEHFEKYFDSYVKYCSNQVYQDRTLKRLNCELPICHMRAKIESDRQCQGLDMRSFLMLPMQRITRYPLLVYAILDRVERVDPTAHQHTLAARALILANQVVRNCNEGARRMERTEQLLEIERRMVYKSPDLKRIPLVSSGRYVVKSGTITQLLERRSKAKLNMLQSKQRARGIYLFLFSDLLVIAKKKVNGTFVCKDYAQRRFIVIEPVEPHSHKVPVGAVSALPGKPHLFFCILMQNARGKQVELLLNAESESDRERWLSAMRPPSCANPDEKIYAEWDCPQAIAVHNYEAAQEDELDLENGDLINILRKMPDGWFYGENIKNSKGGWFPSSYVQQVLNDHVRANNYRQRLKVIQAAADYRLQHHHPSNHPHGQRPISSLGEKEPLPLLPPVPLQFWPTVHHPALIYPYQSPLPPSTTAATAVSRS